MLVDGGGGLGRLHGEQLQSPPVELNKTAVDVTQGVTQAAVVATVSNPTPKTQTFLGSVQGAGQTTLGAGTATVATTAQSVGIGVATDIPELASISWGVTVLYQGVKHWGWVDQDRHKWFWLLFLAVVVGLGMCYLTSHGDIWLSAAKAARGAPLAVKDALLNYHLSKPLGLFSSAAEIDRGDG